MNTANKKQKFAHKDFRQEEITAEKNLPEAMAADNNDIVKRAKSYGINVSKITQEILTAVKNVQGSEGLHRCRCGTEKKSPN
jgi:hypothetical protein